MLRLVDLEPVAFEGDIGMQVARTRARPPSANRSIRKVMSAVQAACSRGHTGSTAVCQYWRSASTSAGSWATGFSYNGPRTAGSGRPSRTVSSSERTTAGGLAVTAFSSSAKAGQGAVGGDSRKPGT